MIGVEFKLETKKDNEEKKQVIAGYTEFDDEKWTKIEALCKYQKASISELISEYLEGLTPEKAEEILISWDL